ncbi:MAG: hypothetical protein L3J03_06130 [Desulfobacterales bacterium]|nr:hypothetical protein [Desulfobacterales bacterium]
MEVTYGELRKKTVAELREMAKGIEHDAIRGYTQLNKEKLLQALCTALGIEAHKKKVARGGKSGTLRARIRAVKVERDAALAERDSSRLKQVRKQLRRLKRMSRRGATAV